MAEDFDSMLNSDTLEVVDLLTRYKEVCDSEDEEEQEEANCISAALEEFSVKEVNDITLIADSYFQKYAEDLSDSLHDVGSSEWPLTCVDWEKAARELQVDYTNVELKDSNGQTYSFWYRA